MKTQNNNFCNKQFCVKGKRVRVLIHTMLLLICCITNQLAFSQQLCFTIKDSISKEVIPYCNVFINSKVGLLTNQYGQFCAQKLKAENSLFIDVMNIAYEQRTIVITNDLSDTVIWLKPNAYNLPEVNINWSKYKFEWIGLKAKDPDYYYNLWRFCHTGLVFPPLKKGNAIFEEVEVPVLNVSEIKVPFRLHLYTIDSLGDVGEELLPENVYGTLSIVDKEEVSLNVLKYQIPVPERGFIVTVELLSNNQPNELVLGANKYYEKYNNRIGFVNARYKHRKYKKVSAWKPRSFYIEEYPFTNADNVVAGLPLIKVKTRRIKE